MGEFAILFTFLRLRGVCWVILGLTFPSALAYTSLPRFLTADYKKAYFGKNMLNLAKII